MMFDLRGKTIVDPFGRKGGPLSCLSHDASTKALRKVCGKSVRCHALQTNRKRIETVAGSRSRNETVATVLGKVWNMKQNRLRFCFKAWSPVVLEKIVSRSRPGGSMEAFRWGMT